ncbi:MAG: hypothetical protein VW646_01300 [Hydrogenophilales bacterium]
MHKNIFNFFVLLLSIIFINNLILFPGGIIRDDGYFYTKIAINFATFAFPTFDGINITDGYHAAWMLILTFLSKLFLMLTDNHFLILKLLFIFWVLIVLLFIHYFARNIIEKLIYLSIFILCSALMETTLLAILIVLFYTKDLSLNKKYLFILYPIFRVDSLLIFLPYFLSLIYKKRKNELIQNGLFVTIGLIFHFTYFKLISGHFFTISSLIKSDKALSVFHHLSRNIYHGGTSFFPFNPLLLIFLFLLILFIYMIYLKKIKNDESIMIGLGVIFFTVFHLFFNLLRPWYFAPALLVLTHLFLNNFSFHYKQNRVLFSLIYFMPTLFIFYNCYNQSINQDLVKDFIKKIDENIYGNEMIYMVDGSGFFGQMFTNHNIINGDGLVNSHQYYNDYFKEKNIEKYLNDKKINYVITNIDNKYYPIGYTVTDSLLLSSKYLRIRLFQKE